MFRRIAAHVSRLEDLKKGIYVFIRLGTVHDIKISNYKLVNKILIFTKLFVHIYIAG